MRIQLGEFIGQRCITAEQGQRLLEGEAVSIDLDGVKTLLSLFLNNALGPLLEYFDRQQLTQLLKFENQSDSQRLTIDLVLENAELYHRNPAMKKAVDDALAKMLEEMD